MNQPFVLFDLDGVIIDSEPQYDIFWREVGRAYQPGIENFEKKIKGTTLPTILNSYFSHFPEEVRSGIVRRIRDFEQEMVYAEVPGALRFIRILKEAGLRIGLVTSSEDLKLRRVFEQMQFDGLFDTVVSADRITQGKPHPMCYLLAAKDLGADPSACFVFEDSFAGIASGTAAGMKVIGLSTTHPAASICDKVLRVIPDFNHFALTDLEALAE